MPKRNSWKDLEKALKNINGEKSSKELCKDLENILKDISGGELRKGLLENIDFILKNFGQPNEFYKGSNPKIKKINEKISNLCLVHKIIFDETYEDVIKKLYLTCIGAENIEDLDNYKDFDRGLKDSLSLWEYGDPIIIDIPFCSPYFSLKIMLLDAQFLLGFGRLFKITYDNSHSEIKEEKSERPPYFE